MSGYYILFFNLYTINNFIYQILIFLKIKNERNNCNWNWVMWNRNRIRVYKTAQL